MVRGLKRPKWGGEGMVLVLPHPSQPHISLSRYGNIPRSQIKQDDDELPSTKGMFPFPCFFTIP